MKGRVFTGLMSGVLASLLLSSTARADDAKSVYVNIEPDCATLKAEELFLEELQVRLPQGTQVIRNGSVPTLWSIHWQWRDDRCRVELHDYEEVASMPLAANAEPARIREATVRLVWFVTMTTPREPEVESEPEPLASKEEVVEPIELPEIPKKVVSASVEKSEPLPDPEIVAAFPVFPVRPRPVAAPARLDPAPSVAPELSVGAAPRASAATALVVALEDWRDSNPGLYRKLESFSGSAPEATLFGKKRTLGMNLSLTGDMTSVNSVPAWLGSLRVGFLLDERISLGVAYKRLGTTVPSDSWDAFRAPPENAFDGEGRITMEAIGLDTELILMPDNYLSVSLGAALSGTSVAAKAIDSDETVRSMMLLAEANAHAFVDVFTWLQAGVGVGYRAPLIQGNDYVVSPKEIRGFSGMFTIRLKVF